MVSAKTWTNKNLISCVPFIYVCLLSHVSVGYYNKYYIINYDYYNISAYCYVILATEAHIFFIIIMVTD